MRNLLVFLTILFIVISIGCNTIDKGNIEPNEKNNKENQTSLKEEINSSKEKTSDVITEEINSEKITEVNRENAPQSDEIIEIVYGNTSGNLNNMGYAATDGEWIYYLKLFYSDYILDGVIYKVIDEDKDGMLYRTKLDGTEKQALYGGDPAYINIVGEWIYFIKDNGLGEGPIYKVKKDGTDIKKLNNDFSLLVTAVNDWIYYINASDNYNIYKMKADGSQRTMLNNEESSNMNIVGDWIYYTSEGNIYKMKTNGSQRTLILESEQGKADAIIVQNEWIYYICTNKYNKNDSINKIKIDGTGFTSILSGEPYDYLNLDNEWIYYTTYEGIEWLEYIYKVKKDGTNKQKLTYGLVGSIIGDWMYYRNFRLEDGPLEHMRIKLDGSIDEIVE